MRLRKDRRPPPSPPPPQPAPDRPAWQAHLDPMERPNAQDLAAQHNVFADTMLSPVPLPKWLRGKARSERDRMS